MQTPIINPSSKKQTQPSHPQKPPTDTDTQLTPPKAVDATVPPQPNVSSPTFFVDDSDNISDRPQISVGNSGWQPSDIWRDIRIDSFYD